MEKQKVLSSGHLGTTAWDLLLRNNSVGLVRVITIDDTQSLDLNTVFLSTMLAWPKGPVLLFFIFWRGSSIKILTEIENLEFFYVVMRIYNLFAPPEEDVPSNKISPRAQFTWQNLFPIIIICSVKNKVVWEFTLLNQKYRKGHNM